jgi:hypothetical protein
MKPIYFDIETSPLPEADIRPLMPEFTAPGNYKDPEKIKANIAEQQAKWLADGALSAITGRVLCVGTLGDDVFLAYENEDEAKLLDQWWGACALHLRAGNRMIGFCCKTFDLPFLIRRSWRYGIQVPNCVFDGRWFDSGIVDVAERWALGNRDTRDRISLDNLSKFLGIGAKNGDGKDFAALWATDRTKAIEYLKNDLELTKRAYERMITL